jgi:hypothetical protein
MMGVAIFWFFGGLYCGIIYFYPPVLFLIGLIAVFKGMAEGNINGNRRSYDAMTRWN